MTNYIHTESLTWTLKYSVVLSQMCIYVGMYVWADGYRHREGYLPTDFPGRYKYLILLMYIGRLVGMHVRNLLRDIHELSS